MNKTAIHRSIPPVKSGHNHRLDALEKKALRLQIEAQKAWIELVREQISEGEPWARVLACAVMTGTRPEDLRKQFDVPPSTFSRWMGGQHSPSQTLRVRLGEEILRLAEENKDKVPAWEESAG